MPHFDRVIIADWSASGKPSPARPSADAIWLGQTDGTGTRTSYHRSRSDAECTLRAAIDRAQAQAERVLIGFDFPMGYPAGFAARLTGTPTAAAVWAWLADRITDRPDNANNRFEVAAEINRRFGTGPFWGRPFSQPMPDLPMTKAIDYAALGLSERRAVETLVPRAQPVWKLYTTGAAGSQGLMGQPMIQRFSQMPGVAIWPYDSAPILQNRVLLAEVYPSLLAPAVAADPAPIRDEVQVRLLSRALYTLSQQDALTPLFNTPAIAREEGWILGAGQAPALLAAL